MRKYTTFFCLFIVAYGNAQPSSIDELGKALTDAIVAHDSLKFYSLAMPAEGMFELFKSTMGSELSEEELKTAKENLNVNYAKSLEYTYAMTFFNLTNKVDIFNLSFDDIVYETMETEETREVENLVGVHGVVDHETYKHITFFASPYKEKWYLFNHVVSISEVNSFDTRAALRAIELEEDETAFLKIEGSFHLDEVAASMEERMTCLDNFPIVAGKDMANYGTDEDPEMYVNGTWSFNYYLGRDDVPAGAISYDYRYTVKEDAIHFTYTNFTHSQEDSEFVSVGQLPFEANDTVLATFTQTQYEEILSELLFEARRGIKSRKYLMKHCLKNK